MNYYNNKKYKILFEDSLVGYNSVIQVTDIVFIYNNDTIFKSDHCYIFDDLEVLM